jgi:hypothetical protein
VTSDGSGELTQEHLNEHDRGLNKQFTLADLLRQEVDNRLVGWYLSTGIGAEPLCKRRFA